MNCFFRLFSLMSVLIGGGLIVAPAQPSRPEITMLRCSIENLDFRPSLGFAWQTENADAVRVESGYVDEQGEFHPGGWHIADDLPPQGSGIFLMKIDNSTVRVCITAPEIVTGPECAVCVPWE